MPRYRPRLTVPTFRQGHIDVAESCAWALWFGINYESGKPLEVSDARFLDLFVKASRTKILRPISAFPIQEIDVRRLIRVGRLYAMYRARNSLNFSDGIASLEQASLTYSRYISGQLVSSSHELASDISLDVAKNFVIQSPSLSSNVTYRVALASRLLVYSIPDLPIFNFSQGIKKALGLNGDPKKVLPLYFAELDHGMFLNVATLSKLTPPPIPSGLYVPRWNTPMMKTWWERRVYDLALLLYFRVTTPHGSAIQHARQLKSAHIP